MQALAAEDTQRLMVRGMIAAAKADGVIDQAEMGRIMGKIGDDGVTGEEKQMVMDELMRPLNLEALAAEVPNEAVASQLYAASLLAIEVDTKTWLGWAPCRCGHVGVRPPRDGPPQGRRGRSAGR